MNHVKKLAFQLVEGDARRALFRCHLPVGGVFFSADLVRYLGFICHDRLIAASNVFCHSHLFTYNAGTLLLLCCPADYSAIFSKNAIVIYIIVGFIYSMGRIMLSIKAISSSVNLYFLYNISSVQGWEKSWMGTNWYTF